MVDHNPPNSQARHRACLIQQAQSPDRKVSTRAQQMLTDECEHIFRAYGGVKAA